MWKWLLLTHASWISETQTMHIQGVLPRRAPNRVSFRLPALLRIIG
jgi:hypothetical protein